MHTVCMQCPWKPKEGIEAPGTGVTDCYVQLVLLPAKPSPQSLLDNILKQRLYSYNKNKSLFPAQRGHG